MSEKIQRESHLPGKLEEKLVELEEVMKQSRAAPEGSVEKVKLIQKENELRRALLGQ